MTQGEGVLVGIIGGVGVMEILAYFSISSEGLIVMTAMLVLDFIFGLVSAKARGEQIESKKREHGLVKKIARWLLPFIVVGGLKWTGMPGIQELVNVTIGMIVFSELYSVIGHIYSINYGEQLPEVDAFKMLLNWLVKLIKNTITKKAEELGEDEEL